MTNRRSPFAFTLLAAALGFGQTALAGPVAIVNGKPISEEAFNEYLEENHVRPEQVKDAAERRDYIDQLVARELVYQDAVAKKLEKNKEVQEEIDRAKKMILVNADVQAAMKANPPTDAEAEKEYNELKPRLAQQEFKARHVLVKSEDEAKEIIKQLESGGDFAKIAKDKSMDRSSQEGGDLGWFGERQMVPEFTNAVKSLKKGEYTKQPVKTQFGFHVVLLEDTRTAEAPPFDKVKPQLKQLVAKKHLADYIESLRKKADVKIP